MKRVSRNTAAVARTILVCSFLLASPPLICVSVAQQVIYVDIDASGAGNGSSWSDAFTGLQPALQSALFGDEIWVAEGIYKPITPADPANVTDPERSTSFKILDGVAVYGGFSGVEANRGERDFSAHMSVLSGDLLGDDNDVIAITEPTRADNTWRIVKMGDVDLGPVRSTTTLDGFTITGGNANPPALNPNNAGAGVNVIGFAVPGGESTPIIQNIRFVNNSAVFGGGFGCFTADPVLRNVDFINNSASSDGGGMSTVACNAALRSVRFTDNIAGARGGGMINNRGSSKLFGVSFIGNRAQNGGGAYNLLDTSLFMNTFSRPTWGLPRAVECTMTRAIRTS